MHIFLTGATGFIGNNLAHRLANEGNIVHALCRDEKNVVLNHENITIFKGDITDISSIERAVAGCEQAYHLAAYARVWAKDPSIFYKLNVEGTKNVLDAAKKASVKKIVFTSTAGVLGPSLKKPVEESDERIGPPFTEYEKTKTLAEMVCHEYCNKYGMHIVIVNPPRIYGHGIITESNAVTRLIKLYMEGKWKILPGDGKRTGSYVYIDDVVNGHILAMEKGRAGERYSLGGVNASYIEFFDLLGRLTGKKNKLMKMPVWSMMFAGSMMQFFSKITKKPPLLTPPWIRKYYFDWSINSDKAKRELGYSFINLDEGLKKTIEWIRQQ